MAVCFAVAACYWPSLRFDASSETLVVEGDAEFAAYVATAKRFPSDAFVLLTWEPRAGGPFERHNLERLSALQQRAAQIPGVTGTLSVLDVPLLNLRGQPTLLDDGVSLAEARGYFLGQDLFVNQLISADGQSLGVKVDLEPDAGDAAREQTLGAIRALRANFEAEARIFIGGVPLIGSDMIRFVREDVLWFSIAAVSLITLALVFFFRRLRWVALCLANCVIVIGLEVGILGFLDTPVSVVSANFVSLLAIVAISFTIHLVVRYRELLAQHGDREHAALVRDTMRSKFAPCLYTALTTMVAFTSLLTSGIPPVEDFGWMMSVGVALALLVTYTVFPALLLLLPKGRASSTLGQPLAITRVLGRWAAHRSAMVGALALALAVACGLGVARLSLDSHFSQYFKPASDIRQGLEFIDSHFGGVLPLDIIVQLTPFEAVEVDEDDDFFFAEPAIYPASAWFSSDKVDVADALATYLRGREDVGSVTSLADLATLGAQVLGSERLDDAQLGVLVASLGEQGRAQLVRPVANPDTGELRIGVRMREKTPPADYPQVLADIRAAADTVPGISAAQIQTTGMFILFGQSIRTLFDSQLRTIAYVLLATLAMFFVLLRSFPYALIGIVANALAAMSVLAYMGFAGVPLDMMTITIAAICIGIGVDDAIHYLHRYRDERRGGLDPVRAVLACHRSIGRAIYFTSVTVIAGFSVLVLSNFVPTIYFGLLTAVAMAAALVANLLLLPSLLVLYERLRGR